MENNFRLKSRMRQPVGRTIKNIRRFYLSGLWVAMICLIAWPAITEEKSPEEIVDRIVAVVNNDIVLLSEIEKALAPYVKNIKERRLPEETENKLLSRAREDILDNLINEKLATQKAAELRISVSDEEVNDALEQMKKSMLYSDETFLSFLSETGYTIDDYRKQIRNQIVKSKLLSYEIKSKTVVTREDVEDYYQKHLDEFTSGTLYDLKHIIMLTPKGMDSAERNAVYKKMEVLHQQIKDGAPFEAMAKQYSQSSFANVGGDLGRFAEDDLSGEIKEAVINTEEGGITPVIETDFGYQIFYVQSVITNDGRLTDEVADKIHEKLYNEKLDEKFNAWITQLRDSAHIKIIE